jgi:hypothetical protein
MTATIHFTPTEAGFRNLGEHSGEHYLEQIQKHLELAPKARIEVDLSQLKGASDSWLDEVLGGLIRSGVHWEKIPILGVGSEALRKRAYLALEIAFLAEKN